MRTVTVAATQMACSRDRAANLDRAERLVRAAAADGAGIVLLQELFETRYFCADERPEHFALAAPFAGNPTIARFAALAPECGVVLPFSFFERDRNSYYNSLAMIDVDGAVLGLYRKSHISQGPGYREKYFFAPGDTGFRVFDTAGGGSARRCAGISGFRSVRARWHSLVPSCCSIRPRSAASRWRRATTARATGGARCRGTPPPTWCR